MASEKLVIESTLSPETAFSQMIDLLRVTEWDRGIRQARLIGGESAVVGARYELTLKGFDGAPTTAEYELTAVDAPRGFTMVGNHPEFRAEDTVSFEPTSTGCRVTYDAGLVMLQEPAPMTEVQLSGTFAKVVAIVDEGLSAFLAAESPT
jgi:hypothetical protein